MIIYILATYLVTVVLTSTDGPFAVFARGRNSLAALRCFVCCSVYVGALLALYPACSFLNWLILSLGYAGGAVVLDRLTLGRL